MTVIGVVGRVKQYGLDGDGRIAIYIPQRQAAARSVYVAIRTTGDPARWYLTSGERRVSSIVTSPSIG